MIHGQPKFTFRGHHILQKLLDMVTAKIQTACSVLVIIRGPVDFEANFRSACCAWGAGRPILVDMHSSYSYISMCEKLSGGFECVEKDSHKSAGRLMY